MTSNRWTFHLCPLNAGITHVRHSSQQLSLSSDLSHWLKILSHLLPNLHSPWWQGPDFIPVCLTIGHLAHLVSLLGCCASGREFQGSKVSWPHTGSSKSEPKHSMGDGSISLLCWAVSLVFLSHVWKRTGNFRMMDKVQSSAFLFWFLLECLPHVCLPYPDNIRLTWKTANLPGSFSNDLSYFRGTKDWFPGK